MHGGEKAQCLHGSQVVLEGIGMAHVDQPFAVFLRQTRQRLCVCGVIVESIVRVVRANKCPTLRSNHRSVHRDRVVRSALMVSVIPLVGQEVAQFTWRRGAQVVRVKPRREELDQPVADRVLLLRREPEVPQRGPDHRLRRGAA